MASSFFVSLKGTENNELNIENFCESLRKKYPGIEVRKKINGKLYYNLVWEYKSGKTQIESAMHKNRCTFAISYFNSENRLKDFAEYILWLRSWLPNDREVIFCDEGYEEVLVIGTDMPADEIILNLGKR